MPLEFASRPKIDKNTDRTLRSFLSACGRVRVIEVKSHLDGMQYWLAARVLATGEFPIQLPDRQRHYYRTRDAAERACRWQLAHEGVLTDPQPSLFDDEEPMSRKAKSTKSAKSSKPSKTKKPAGETKRPAGETREKKVGALDAAAEVLAKAKEPMNCKELIDAMAKAGLWTSPGGKTPDATLYSAIIREIAKKGKESRFKKADRGRFALAG
jgi:hypothetical protein